MNELMVKIDGYIYYKTSEHKVSEAIEKLKGLFEGANINIDNVCWEAVLRNVDNIDISETIMWKG